MPAARRLYQDGRDPDVQLRVLAEAIEELQDHDVDIGRSVGDCKTLIAVHSQRMEDMRRDIEGLSDDTRRLFSKMEEHLVSSARIANSVETLVTSMANVPVRLHDVESRVEVLHPQVNDLNTRTSALEQKCNTQAYRKRQWEQVKQVIVNNKAWLLAGLLALVSGIGYGLKLLGWIE